MTRPDSGTPPPPDVAAFLLEASPEELRELAVARPEYRPRIDAILAGQAAIGEFVAGRTVGPRSGRVTAAADGAPVRTWRGARIVVPTTLLAAAVVALLLGRALVDDTGVPGSTSDPSSTTARLSPAPLGLDVETDSDFAVFPTDDPDIAVVWLLNGDDE